jgi:hypothetical protein
MSGARVSSPCARPLPARPPRLPRPRTGARHIRELARETKLPLGVLKVALTELVHAGKAAEVEPGPVTGSVRFSCEGTELREYAREVNLLPAYRLDSPIPLSTDRPVDLGSEL